MRHQRFEAWVLDVVDRVSSSRSFEDDRVELKANWPTDFRRTARQIAGHANQARGEEILWLIGIDEKRGKVVSTTPTELADWWRSVERWFDELAPEVSHLDVATPGGGSVQALLFETSRAPYVIKTSGGDSEREVPWRSLNGTRSARRSELLRSLVEEAQVPRIECFGGGVEFSNRRGNDGEPVDVEQVDISIELRLYFEATGPCTLPQHRWGGTLSVGDLDLDLKGKLAMVGPTRPIPGMTRSEPGWFAPAPREDLGTIAYVDGSGLHIGGSEAVQLTARFRIMNPQLQANLLRRQKVLVRITLPLANSTRVAGVEAGLHRMPMRDVDKYDYDLPLANFSFGPRLVPSRSEMLAP